MLTKEMPTMEKKILVVDDEQSIADLVELYLTAEGFTVLKFYNGTDALACIEQEDLSMAILDVMLPDINGFKLCQKIREKHFYPVIMLTAKIEDIDKITGLTIGADDYITKPFNPLELVARVKTQFQRYEKYNHPEIITGNSSEETIDIGGLSISLTSHSCTLNGKELILTPREFSILWYLCKNHRRVVSSEEIFEHVWGEKFLNSNNTVMTHIGRIREKMNDSRKNPKYIKTVWGVGYQIE